MTLRLLIFRRRIRSVTLIARGGERPGALEPEMLAEKGEGVMEVCNIGLQELDVPSARSALVFSLRLFLTGWIYFVSSISDCRLRFSTQDNPRRRHRAQGGPSSDISQRIYLVRRAQ